MIAPPILTSKPIESKEEKKSEMTLNFQNDTFQLSLFNIDNKIIRFDLSCVNEKLNQYQKEFNYDNFLELNKIFKIYDNFEEIEADLINYFKEKKIKISEIKETEAILHFVSFLSASKDNIINVILTKKQLSNTDKINILFEKLEQKDKRIISLENALNESNKIIKGLQEEIKKINERFKEQMNDDTSQEKNNADLKFEYLQIFLNFNIPSIFKKSDFLYDIYFFPNSKNKLFLFEDEMNIYKPNMELIESMEADGSKHSLCIIDENFIAYAEEKDIKFLRDDCEFSSIKKAFSRDVYKIIKGFNENEIIAVDTLGVIKFWEENKEEKKFIRIKNKTILSPNPFSDDTNILLVDDILVVGSDKLYFYDINAITPIIKKKKSDSENSDSQNSDKEESDSINSEDFDSLDYSNVSSFKFQPDDYNSMILLDKKEKLFAVKGTIPTEIKEIEYEDINEKEDLNCKVLFVGDLGVGKSSLIQKLDKNIFDGKSYLDSFPFSNPNNKYLFLKAPIAV